MTKPLTLHQSNRKRGSYLRKDFIGDVLYYSFIYRDLHITFAKKGRKNTIINDQTAEQMEHAGFISPEDHARYKDRVSAEFSFAVTGA